MQIKITSKAEQAGLCNKYAQANANLKVLVTLHQMHYNF